MCVCVCVCVCVCACVRACVCACARARSRVLARARAFVHECYVLKRCFMIFCVVTAAKGIFPRGHKTYFILISHTVLSESALL